MLIDLSQQFNPPTFEAAAERKKMIEDILAENIIHRIAPCKHCPKTFIEIFTPYTFSEKASPFFVATKCNTSKLVWRCCKVFQ